MIVVIVVSIIITFIFTDIIIIIVVIVVIVFVITESPFELYSESWPFYRTNFQRPFTEY